MREQQNLELEIFSPWVMLGTWFSKIHFLFVPCLNSLIDTLAWYLEDKNEEDIRVWSHHSDRKIDRQTDRHIDIS